MRKLFLAAVAIAGLAGATFPSGAFAAAPDLAQIQRMQESHALGRGSRCTSKSVYWAWIAVAPAAGAGFSFCAARAPTAPLGSLSLREA